MKKKKFLSVMLILAMVYLAVGTSVLAEEYTADEAQVIVETTSAAPMDSTKTDIGLTENAGNSVVVQIGGNSATLTANQFNDGKIYVAFYTGNGKLNSLKMYSPNTGNIKVNADENAAYAKVMWWNENQLPNCEAQEIKLKDQYSINYYIANNDNYLQSISIENPNPSYYFAQDGLVLQDLIVDGYNFLGWYTSQSGGERVTEITPGTNGNKTLYAHWEIVNFTVQFASDMIPQSPISYTTGTGSVLPKPALDKYTFVGWSDKDGKIWDSIPVGTSGNMTLYANWASNRNKAEAVKQLADPIICEDSESGLILFTYEIGEITNVPLFTTLRLQCANGIITTVSKTDSDTISDTQAKTIAQTISNATTNSSSWTLSNNWSSSTEVSESYLDQTGQTREEAETLAKSESGSYNLTNSNGGSNGSTDTLSGSYKLSGNNSHSDSSTVETGQNFELSVDAKYSSEVSGKVALEGIAEVGGKTGFEIGAGAGYGNNIKHTNTGTDAASISADIAKQKSNTTTNSKTWNSSMGYSQSNSTSQSSSVSNAVSKIISKQYGYGSSYAEGGSNSSSQALATTDTKSDEYSSTVTYYTSHVSSTTESFSSTGQTHGDYRMVMAGTVHVFAVVGYDVANKAYFVYTYNVLDDETSEYLDYSFDGTFNDYETSIIPFEIPYFVNEYVNSRIAKTEGLQLDPDTGIIENYFPDEENPDGIVIIPSYISVDNGDGTSRSVKVKGIAPGLFKDNTDIVAVRLGDFITEIPDSTFEGCSSLQYVISPGVTKIGNNAFNGCTSLMEFTLPEDITYLGDNAFESAPSIKAEASNVDVATAAASSGANNIVLDISSVPDSEITNTAFNVGEIESFELQGKDKEYKGISVKSDAKTTVINGIKFVDCTNIPMEISSEDVTLNRVSANARSFALILGGSNVNVKLNQNINLTSSKGNAVLCKNITLSPLNSNVVGKMTLTGDLYTIDPVGGEKYLTFNSGEIKYITEEEYESFAFAPAIAVWDGTATEPEYDASTKTYTITSGSELVWISNVVNGTITDGTNFPTDITFKGYTVELAEDIYLNNTSDWQNWSDTNAPTNSWVPIGNDDDFPFNGTFNGNNHEVFGLYLVTYQHYCGLFGYIGSYATLKNVGVSESYISSDNINGGVVGYNDYGTVSHCYNTGSVNGRSKLYAYAGGVVGYNCGGTVSYCFNTGFVNGSGSDNGGVVGCNVLSGAISYCYNTGSVSNSGFATGGVVGNTSGGTVSYCYNIGDVSGSDVVGGVVGHNYADATVSYCYNIGDVSSSDRVGGIVGSNECLKIYDNVPEENPTIKYCYATQSTLYNNYSNEYKHTIPTITSVLQRTAEQMKSLSNLPGFSTSDWAVDANINDGYPYLIALKDTY